MFRSVLSVLLAATTAFAPLVAGAKPASERKSSLTIEQIMRGPNLVGTEPAQVRWSGDSTKIYFQWKKATDPENAPPDTYVVNRDGSELRKLSHEEARLAPPYVAETNRDRSLSVFTQDGDIIVMDNATGKRRQVTKTAEPEMNPRFTPDGHHITFQRGTNLFLMSLDDGDLEQLTDIHPFAPTPVVPTEARGQGGSRESSQAEASKSAESDKEKKSGSQEYLDKEQAELFETVRDREAQKKEHDAEQKKLNPRKPYTLHERQTLNGLQLSPDGKYVLGVLTQADPDAKTSNVPNWITDSSYPEDITGRTRVGDDLQRRHLLIINVATGEAKEVDHDQLKLPVSDIVDGGGCGGRPAIGGGGWRFPRVSDRKLFRRWDKGRVYRARPGQQDVLDLWAGCAGCESARSLSRPGQGLARRPRRRTRMVGR